MSLLSYPELLPEWVRLDRLLEREILRLRARYQLSLDEFRGLYISDEHVDRLIGEVTGSPVETLSPEQPLNRGTDSRLGRLATTLGLKPLEIDLVVLGLAPEVDTKYETLLAYLNDDVTRRWPTADLASRVLSATEGVGAAEVLGALAADAPLARLGVLRSIEPPTGRPSVLNTGYKLARSVVHYLLGLDALPPELVAFTRKGVSAIPPELQLPSTVRGERIRRLPELLRERGQVAQPLVILLGPTGSGAEPIAASTARELGRELLVVDLDAARTQPGWPEQPATDVALYLRLSSSAALVTTQCAPEHSTELVRALTILRASEAPIFVACDSDSDWRYVARSFRTVSLDLAASDFTERHDLWQSALARAGLDAPPATCAALATRFSLSPQQIDLAVNAALDLAVLSDASNPDMEALICESARRLLDQRLGKLASKVTITPTWDDLVLPAMTRSRLRELASAVKCRHVVYAEWGFGRRTGTGAGIKALFAGSSGTGKTMTAAVLANELGFDLYRIDLSGVVSKYIGETEKNLDEIFRGARAGQAILFFDEADALFGKRSEVKDAHDRYANIEVAYLLQKLEEHDGIVILATNLKRNIDEAFARRMHCVIEFPVPDAQAREALWRGMFPAEVPMGGDVDLGFLARQFVIPGGDIRNVALDAAFMAAQNGRVITMKELVRATARQLVKQGKMPSAAEFQQYQGWVISSSEGVGQQT